MKNAAILMMLACAVVYAAHLYGVERNHSNSSAPAKFISGLHGLDRVLLPDAKVTFRYPAHNEEVYSSCRYFLAPAYLSIVAGEHFDTTLTVSLLSDTTAAITLEGQRVLWQNSDSMYHYYLTCSR